MKRTITGKKIMAVLMAASLTLTPVEMASAEELLTEQNVSEDNDEITAEDSGNEAETDLEESEEALENLNIMKTKFG